MVLLDLGFLSSTTVSILVNDSPTKEFKIERGLRQGDPLSPFLFLLVAEALQISILEACNKNLFKGLYLKTRTLILLHFNIPTMISFGGNGRD